MNVAKGERFRLFLNVVEGNKRGSQAKFAEKVGCGRAQVTNWLKGRTSPSSEYEQKIIELYRLNPSWLKYGEGEMFLEQEPEKIFYLKDTSIQELVDIVSEIEDSTQFLTDLKRAVKIARKIKDNNSL